MELTDPPSTSTTLVNQLRAGERSAWFRFVGIYTPLIESWCRQQGIRRSADYEDIVQNVFAAVLQNIQEFGRGRVENSFRAWLWKITHSKIVDCERLAKKTPNTLGKDFFAAVEAPCRLAETRDEADSEEDLNILVSSALKVIKSDFTTQTWTAFWENVALGRPPSEIAKELGMSTAAVCMCRNRVMLRIRETLGL